ncbi:histamine H2 receptor-like [Lineus longissimus]|uniref:histamine H2 receptor-like n=1 Tax=Lineus longissimus TaxID=88925 RepID=UPI00315D618F
MEPGGREEDSGLALGCEPAFVDREWYTVSATMELILMAVTIVANVFVIFAVLRHKKLMTATNYFVLSLSVADLFVGLAMPLDAATHIYPPLIQSRYVCLVRYSLIYMACGASVTSMLWIAVDRYVAVTYSLRYPSIMTSERASLAIILIWIVNIFAGFLPLLGLNRWRKGAACSLECTLDPEYIFSCFVYTFVCGIVMAFIHFMIFHKALGQNRRISAQHNATGPARVGGRIMKSIWTLVIILGTYMVCWLPMELIVISQFFHYNPSVSMYKTAALFLGVLNSCLNPFIYGWRNRELRNVFWVYLKGRRASSESTTSRLSTVTSRVEAGEVTEISEPPRTFENDVTFPD